MNDRVNQLKAENLGTLTYFPDGQFTARHHRSHGSFGAGALLAWSLEHFWLLKENLTTDKQVVGDRRCHNI